MKTKRRISVMLLILWVSGGLAAQPANKPELELQKGHSGLVMCMAFSPDGRLIATGGGDNTIKLWNVDSGKVIRTFEAHAGPFSLAFNPTGKILASANDDATIRLWDIDEGVVIRSFEGHSSLRSVAFSPDGKLLASAGGDPSRKDGATIKFWDAEKCNLLQTLEAHTSVVSIAFSPDGKLLASDDFGSSIKLWNVQTGKLSRILKKSDSEYASVAFAFSPDSKLLATVGAEINSEKNISLWDVQKGEVVRTIKGQKKPKSTYDPAYKNYQAFDIESVAFSPDGQKLAAGISDNTIRLLEAKSGKLIRIIEGRSGRAPVPLVFSSDSKTIAAIASDGGSVGTGRIVNVWNTDTGKLVRSLEEQSGAALSLTFSRDGVKLISGSVEETVNLWNTKAGRLVRSLNGRSPMLVLGVAISPDGKIVASRSTSAFGPGNIKLWDMETGRLIQTISDFSKKSGDAVVFSPQGDLIASVDGSSVRIWEVLSGRLIHNVDTNKEGDLYSLEFSPNGKTIVAVGEYKNIIFLDVESGRLGRGFSAQDASPVYRATFSPDGKTIASAPIDLFKSYKTHAIRLWDVESGALLKTFEGHPGSVGGLSFNSNGRFLVSGDTEGIIKLWDVSSGQLIRTFDGHYGSANSVVFSPDGRAVASALDDGTIKVWSVETGQLLVSLLAFEDGNWAAVAPDGLFDGSPSALNKISWRFSPKLSDVAPVESFFNEFYYPGLLSEIMSGQRPKAKQEISQKDRRQPRLSLTLADGQAAAGSRMIRVRIEVSEMPSDRNHAAGSGARDVRLFRNGSLVHVWRGDVLQNKGGQAVLESTLPIVAGENKLTAYSFNNDNIKSADATLSVNGAESLKRTGTAYVFAVAINSYVNSQYDLRYAVADAKAFGEEFRQQQLKLGRFAKVEVVPLFDKDATKTNILLALKRLAGSDSPPLPAGVPSVLQSLHSAQPEDAVVVYFAGHGTAQQNKFFLVPYDLGYQGSRTQLDRAALDTILDHSISDRELEQAFEEVDAGQLLFIIDACNSGQALEAEEKRRGPMNSKGLAQLAYEKGMYILTAAQSYQAALETPQRGHGYLTYALVEEGLNTASADVDPRDGEVTVREWLDYATQRVPQLQEEDLKHPKQTNVPVAQTQTTQQKSQRTTRPQRGKQGTKGTQQQEAEKARQFERDKPQATRQGASEEKFLQQPRVFYRREIEPTPLVVARPN